MEGRMKIVRKKLFEIQPAYWNPRTMSADDRRKLINSIEQFGLVEPIVWNERTGHIVAGHQRRDALLEIGQETETDMVVVDLPPEEEKALNLALNRIRGQWDFGKLVEIASGFSTDELRMKTGFDPHEIAQLTGIPMSVRAGEPIRVSAEKTVTCPKCGYVFVP
jgi:ParB-like chromosome segregation protein Spo0J